MSPVVLLALLALMGVDDGATTLIRSHAAGERCHIASPTWCRIYWAHHNKKHTLFDSSAAGKDDKNPSAIQSAPPSGGGAPHQVGVAPHQAGVAPHQAGVAPHQAGGAPHQAGGALHQVNGAPPTVPTSGSGEDSQSRPSLPGGGAGSSRTQAKATVREEASGTRLTATLVNEQASGGPGVSVSGGVAVAGKLNVRTPFGSLSLAGAQSHTLNHNKAGGGRRR